MRLFSLLALVLALPAAAQTWTMDGMLEEMVPVLLTASNDDFAPLRGDLIETRGADTLWASLYRPAGPSGPLYSRTAVTPSVNQSMYWFTIRGTDSTYVQRLYGTALGALNGQLGRSEGDAALGWMLAVAENTPARKVVQWIECANVGRVAEATYEPTDEGARITVSLARRGGQDCPPNE